MLGKKALGNASKNKCIVGKLFQGSFLFLKNGERGCRVELFMREYMEGNGSAKNGSKISCTKKVICMDDKNS